MPPVARQDRMTGAGSERDATDNSSVVPLAAWPEAEARAAALIIRSTGDSLSGHLTARLRIRPGVRMLALGQNAGVLALELAAAVPQAEIECLGVNAALCAQGEASARDLGLNVRLAESNLNELVLERGAFDVIF